MNPVSAFFVRNIIVVFFLYGLAFFALGLALLLAARRKSEFRFAQAIVPMAAFGILHGLHQWYEMYQKYATLTGGYNFAIMKGVTIPANGAITVYSAAWSTTGVGKLTLNVKAE